jgi:membrane-bound lytic murein transglycosylase D
MTRYRLDDFWELAGKRNSLPRETREYVPMVLAAIVIARNPAEYGFDLVASPPLDYQKVKVPQPIDLRKIAEWAGTTVSEIQGLNPELRKGITPVPHPRRETYEIKVPRESAAALEARLAELTPADTAALKYYTVKRGDTLTTIARKLRVNRIDLADANYLSTKSLVSPGQNLVIPIEPARLMAGRQEPPAASAAPRAAAAPPKAGTPKDASRTPAGTVRVTYQVKRGDTLSGVAKLYGTTVASLKAWNGLRGDLLMPGSRLTIFAAREERQHQP